MKAIGNRLTYTTHTGHQVQHGNTVVTPVSRVLKLKLPYFGFIWKHPIAVLVENGDARTKLPIVDVTLMVQMALLATSVTLAILTVLLGRARIDDSRD